MKKIHIALCAIIGFVQISNAQFLGNGDIVSPGTNSWIFHTPDDGRTSLYIVPNIPNKSDFLWEKGFEFKNNGDFLVNGTVNANYLIVEPQDGVHEGGEIVLKGSGSYSPIQIDNFAGQFRVFTDSGERIRINKDGSFTNKGNFWNEGNFWNAGDITTDNKLIANQIIIKEATSKSENSPGLTLVVNDNFLYKGKYLNHYGLGFYKDEYSDVKNYISGYFGIDFFTNGDNRMTIKGNGSIGIGTENPDARLTVKGQIHAEEIRVDLQIPADYVFQKYYTGISSLKADYQFPTLTEVESFTKENHHLPNIPSAKVIQENGLQLGEMSNLLLQKIEELTLYIIEQEKEMKTLKSELKEIKESMVLKNKN